MDCPGALAVSDLGKSWKTFSRWHSHPSLGSWMIRSLAELQVSKPPHNGVTARDIQNPTPTTSRRENRHGFRKPLPPQSLSGQTGEPLFTASIRIGSQLFQLKGSQVDEAPGDRTPVDVQHLSRHQFREFLHGVPVDHVETRQFLSLILQSPLFLL